MLNKTNAMKRILFMALVFLNKKAFLAVNWSAGRNLPTLAEGLRGVWLKANGPGKPSLPSWSVCLMTCASNPCS
ncbi:hypothetical protein A6P54_09530 [Bacillus sp. MKU004]|nr:hypothetical protein A6P54_09530 [Bacillus sp. MKU004]